jgi:hypothetical protein
VNHLSGCLDGNVFFPEAMLEQLEDIISAQQLFQMVSLVIGMEAPLLLS